MDFLHFILKRGSWFREGRTVQRQKSGSETCLLRVESSATADQSQTPDKSFAEPQCSYLLNGHNGTNFQGGDERCKGEDAHRLVDNKWLRGNVYKRWGTAAAVVIFIQELLPHIRAGWLLKTVVCALRGETLYLATRQSLHQSCPPLSPTRSSQAVILIMTQVLCMWCHAVYLYGFV